MRDCAEGSSVLLSSQIWDVRIGALHRCHRILLPPSKIFKAQLHVLSKLPFLCPLKMGSTQTVLWCCFHIVLKRSKVPLTKTVTLMVCGNEPLCSFCSSTFMLFTLCNLIYRMVIDVLTECSSPSAFLMSPTVA